MLLAAASVMAIAGNFEDGMKADNNKNYTKAVKYYQMAVDQGNAAAQFALGTMYDRGEGVKQDHMKAQKLYKMARDQGHPAAEFLIR